MWTREGAPCTRLWYRANAMSEHERNEPERDEHERGEEVKKVQDTSLTINSGSAVTVGEGLILHAKGPTTDGIRTSDSRGWTARADIEAGVMDGASATGVPSENEDLTLETGRYFVGRLNRNGTVWSEPVEQNQQTGGGMDAEARDIRDPSHRLQMQVIRAEVDGEFWRRLQREARSDIPSHTAEEAANRIWTAIQRKRLRAHRNVVLLLNAIRTPWLALPSVVDAFRRLYGQDARRIGFQEMWIVGANETFTERLDIDGRA